MADGFSIIYVNDKGHVEQTFMGCPETNIDEFMDMSLEELREVVCFFFEEAHPGCFIVSMRPCSWKEYSAQ